MIDAQRDEYRGRLMQRFWLRFHMTLMLAATVGTGALANKALLAIPVHSMTGRWLIALIISYAAFFAFIRLWLAYVGARPLALDVGDVDGAVMPNVDIGPGAGQVFHGGGGLSGGGGASGDFGVGDTVSAPFRTALDGAGSLGLDDEGGCLLVVLGIVLLALLAGIGGGVVFLIVSAPHLLADAAFSALLAGGLVKSIRRIDEGDWEGSVLRSTWKPLAIVALVTVVAGIVAHVAAPGARTLGEVLMLVR